MPDDTRPRVVKLRLVLPCHPALWEGKTDDCRFVFIRVKYGDLRVGLSAMYKEAALNVSDNPFYFKAGVGDLEGSLEYQRLVTLLRDHIVLPDEAEVENDW